MEILKFPNPLLFKPGVDVTVFGPELLVLLESMWQIMKDNRGLGLAANQVGLNYNMFVMECPNKEKLFIVNPNVLSKSAYPAGLTEGCLSAPGEKLLVPTRKQWILLEYLDEAGTKKNKTFEGIYSVCVQHEIEHLEGKGFLESAQIPKRDRKRLAAKWGLKI